MIKDYVIVTIVYLNAFYREKGQMISYTLIIRKHHGNGEQNLNVGEGYTL